MGGKKDKCNLKKLNVKEIYVNGKITKTIKQKQPARSSNFIVQYMGICLEEILQFMRGILTKCHGTSLRNVHTLNRKVS